VSDAVEGEIVVAADADSIMDVIADFEAYPEWQEDIKDVEVLETDADGWGTKVRFAVDAKITEATLVLSYTYEDLVMRWFLVDGDKVTKNDGAYILTPRDDGTTLVRYELEVAPAFPLPKMMRRQAAKTIVDGALKAMKARVEGLL
jgi:uncharacterized membrane protein